MHVVCPALYSMPKEYQWLCPKSLYLLDTLKFVNTVYFQALVTFYCLRHWFGILSFKNAYFAHYKRGTLYSIIIGIKLS